MLEIQGNKKFKKKKKMQMAARGATRGGAAQNQPHIIVSH